MKLETIYQVVIKKHYPEVHRTEIERYCQFADSQDVGRTVNTGVGSLKWALEAINETSCEQIIGSIMRDIIFELLARGWDYYKLETHITSFAAIRPYKQLLFDRLTPPVNQINPTVI